MDTWGPRWKKKTPLKCRILAFDTSENVMSFNLAGIPAANCNSIYISHNPKLLPSAPLENDPIPDYHKCEGIF
jgi:hypothetical protein